MPASLFSPNATFKVKDAADDVTYKLVALTEDEFGDLKVHGVKPSDPTIVTTDFFEDVVFTVL